MFDRERAARFLTRLRLPKGVLEREADSLSEGEQQRVSVVRALLVQPRVLLLDEPTSALDPESLRQTEALLRECLDRDAGSVALVSHDPEQTRRFDETPFQLQKWRANA